MTRFVGIERAISMSVHARLSLKKLFAFILATLACSAPDPTSQEPSWPPSEGTYCGGSPSTCDELGSAWTCGPRPVWHQLDCENECASRGLSYEGCLVLEGDDREALADQILPGDGSSAAISEVTCLCSPAEKIECAGPGHRLCRDRSTLLICTNNHRWSEASCSSICASLTPSLRQDRCVHRVGPGDSDACRCTARGALCAVPGLKQCIGSYIFECIDGIFVEVQDCRMDSNCASPADAACIFDGEVSCGCEAS